MQRRLLIIALVFVAGFGVGYGITWLLVGSSSRQTSEAPRQAQANTVAPATGTPAADTASPGPDSAAIPDAGATAAPEAGDAKPAAAAGDGSAAPALEVVNAAAEVADSAAKGASDGAADSGAAGADAAAPAKPAWEACHLHVCRLDFGRVSGGISIRKGSLEHGQPVDWDRDFAKADKVGTLDAGKNVRVEVLAVGLQGGVPAAAYIMRKTKREELKGVIALRIGDKALTLEPLPPE